MLSNRRSIAEALTSLAMHLELAESAPLEIVVIGGAAMNATGIISRPTRDVDVLALGITDQQGGVSMVKCDPLPAALLEAAEGVARDLDLDDRWLNAGPADLLDHGLPAGFEGRLTRTEYGLTLAVLLPAREDLICMKVFAAADSGIGRHTEDLAALKPTGSELLAGARWARTQDPSEGFRTMLVALLRYMDAQDEAEGLLDDA